MNREVKATKQAKKVPLERNGLIIRQANVRARGVS